MLKFKKIMIILIFALLIISNACYVNSFEGNFDEFDNGARNINGVTGVVDNIGGTLISVIRVVAVTIAIVMLLVIAMRYMVAAPGDRADIKKHAVAYVVGAFVLFGVTAILSILTNFADQITPATP